MFGDYSIGDLGSIFVMQGFAGLILFSVYVLMALGLAIIFGQMGVINMAHGEFMTIGAYTIYLGSHLTSQFAPAWVPYYFPLAVILAFGFAFIGGWLVEWALIRHLYKRPLDTLLATWGLSLILQQAYRSVFGAREVGVELPQWMLGSLKVTESIEVPINGPWAVTTLPPRRAPASNRVTSQRSAQNFSRRCATNSPPGPPPTTATRSMRLARS